MRGLTFDGQVAIVTGAGNGLGRAYAKLLAARGARVLVNDLGGDIHGGGSSEEPAARTAQEIVDDGGIAQANFDSVASGAGGKAIVAQAMDIWGKVDIVVNNAGQSLPAGQSTRTRMKTSSKTSWSPQGARSLSPKPCGDRCGTKTTGALSMFLLQPSSE